MTTLTAPIVHPDTASKAGVGDTQPINLYKLGMLFVVKCSYWSCRAGNDPDELELTPDRIDPPGSVLDERCSVRHECQLGNSVLGAQALAAHALTTRFSAKNEVYN